jgi:hypothetical protein
VVHIQLQLTKLWLTNVVTTEMLGAQSSPDRPQDYAVKGEIRTYAGGRQRAVGSLGASGQWKFQLMELTATQVETLKTWMEAGVTVLARDHRGQSMYGTFFGVTVGENMAQLWQNATYTAEITLQAVDVVEGV